MDARSNDKYVQEREDKSNDQQNGKRDNVAPHYLKLYGSNSKGHQIVCKSAAEMPYYGLGDMFIGLNHPKDPSHKEGGDERAAEYRKHERGPDKGY